MASDINNLTIVGRLTRDAELKYTQGGMALSKMAIAVNRRVKKGESWTDEASFFDVTLFGKLGESLSKYLLKGTQIAVIGELKQDRWQQDGNWRSSVNIVANNIQLLGKPGQGGQSESRAQESQAQAQEDFSGFSDDIPF